MSEFKALIVWVDQGLGHGHIALKTFEDEVEVHSMPISCTDELEVIHAEIGRYLRECADNSEEKPEPDKYKVTGLMSRPPISEPVKTWSVGVDTVRHYDLELNVDLSCGEFAEFLDGVMNTDMFKNRVHVNRGPKEPLKESE